MPSRNNPYTVLGVDQHSSDAAIAAAYRRLIVRWHPDRNPGSGTAEVKAKALNVAYDQLKTPEARGATDARLLGEARAAAAARQWRRQQHVPGHHTPPRTALEFARVVTAGMPAQDALRVHLGAVLVDLMVELLKAG